MSADSKLFKSNSLNSDLLEVKFPQIPFHNNSTALKKKSIPNLNVSNLFRSPR